MVPLLPIVPLVAEKRSEFSGFHCNVANITIGRFTDFTIGRTPNVAIVNKIRNEFLNMYSRMKAMTVLYFS